MERPFKFSFRNTTETAQLVLRQDSERQNCVTGEATMRTKSLSSAKVEARVARFNKLQTYQRQISRRTAFRLVR